MGRPELEKEKLERMVYELEQSKLPVERIAAELILGRELVAACRSASYLPKGVRRALDRFPRLTDRQAWDRLTTEEKQAAATDFMRENFE